MNIKGESSIYVHILIKNRKVGLLLFGQFLSDIGNRLYSLAAIWLIYQTTGSAANVTLFAWAEVIPEILLAFPAGIVVDKVNRKALLFSIEAVRSTAVGIVALLALYDHFGLLNYILAGIGCQWSGIHVLAML